MKKIYTAVFVICSFLSFGSHYIGGTISWKNVGQNQFIFELKLIQKCIGPSSTPASIRQIQSPFGPITANLTDAKGYTPTCELPPNMWCYSFNSSWALTTMVYISDPVTVVGVPPASGWKFYHKILSRPQNVVNVQVGPTVETDIFAMMYPETVIHNLSSPSFVDTYDESITAFNSTLTNQAYSTEFGDSLYYKLGQPKEGTGVPYTFVAGYNHLQPFPTQLSDTANGPMVFNPYTGEIEVDVKVATDGYYAYTMVVEQWRMIDDGQMVMPVKVSTVRKDNLIPVIMSNPNSNSAPNALIDTTLFQNVYKASATSYGVKAHIGDTVYFQIQAIDTDLDSNLLPQQITFDASGAALDSSWGGWELYSSIPELVPLQPGFTSSASNVVSFKWYIAPDLADSIFNSYHTFKFSFTDNNCEAKGKFSISVVVGIAALQDTTSSGVGVNELFKSAVNLYPNPANESFTIDGLTGKSQIQVLDVQGKLVQTYSSTDSKLEVERGSLPSGIYFVKISDSNTTSLHKVMYE